MIADKDQADTYIDHLYKTYISTHRDHIYRDSDMSFLPFHYYIPFLPIDNNARIFDAGCGDGDFLLFLASLGYTNLSGCDLSEEQISCAKKKGLMSVELADAKNYLLKVTEEYDLISALDLLEHLPKQDIWDLCVAVFNSLAPGGKLIASVPNVESLMGTRIAFGDFSHETSFTPGSLAQLLRAIGFKDVQVYPKEPIPHGFKSSVRWLLWKIIKHMIGFYLLVETGSAGSRVYTQAMFAAARKPS